MAIISNIVALTLPRITCVILLFLIGYSRDVNGLAFDSLASLKTLIQKEEWLVDKIQDYLVREGERLKELDSLQERLKRVTWSTKKETPRESWEAYAAELVEHPINALNLIKDWADLIRLAKQLDKFDAVLSSIEDNMISIPNDDDYKGALGALLRLQKTYNISTTDMARGVIQNSTALNGMSPKDFFEMGELAMKLDHRIALTWLELFLEEGSPEYEDKIVTILYISGIYRTAKDFKSALAVANKLLTEDPNNKLFLLVIKNLERLHSKSKRHDEDVNLAEHQTQVFWKNSYHRKLEHYEALCRGENISNNILKNKDLICVYRRGSAPYAQYKEEIHSFSPRISLFIDVISDRQAEMLKKKAYPGLFRARIAEPTKPFSSDRRVSKIDWLWDSDESVRQISLKVADITGLSTDQKSNFLHAEPFQIVNYGIGGQYEPHVDYYADSLELLETLPPLLLNTGDRLATFMFYLSDVTAGGATVFPVVNVKVNPIKNAAVFWYNYDLAGETGDARTLHAGCPVLLGQKWVGNKWIRQEGQQFNRPCALDKHAIDPIWYS